MKTALTATIFPKLLKKSDIYIIIKTRALGSEDTNRTVLLTPVREINDYFIFIRAER